jgi:hypothetical protein
MNLHEAARSEEAMVAALKMGLLTPAALAERDSRGRTVLHIAASSKTLGCICSDFLTPELVKMEDADGFTVGSCAAFFSQWDAIPSSSITASLLTKKDLLNNPLIYGLAGIRALKTVPAALLTPEIVSLRGQNQETVAHVAARQGCLQDIPLTRDLLEMRDDNGVTVACAAARAKCLDQVPPELITKEILALKDKNGETVLNHAIGQLQVLPKTSLTTELLCATDSRGFSWAHTAAFNGHFDKVPRELWTWETLTAGGKKHSDVLGWALMNDPNVLPLAPLVADETKYSATLLRVKEVIESTNFNIYLRAEVFGSAREEDRDIGKVRKLELWAKNLSRAYLEARLGRVLTERGTPSANQGAAIAPSQETPERHTRGISH